MAGTSRIWQTALWCWVILALAVGVRNYLKPASHTVYPVFAEGARHWWAGQSLYDVYPGIDLFRYSPSFAIALTPFASLDDRLGSILWSWLSVVIYFLGLRRMVRDLLPQLWPPYGEPVFMILALLGGLSGLWNGQSNALLIGLVLWGCSALARRQWWLAAGLWSVCILCKLPLLAIVMLFVALQPRPLLGRLIVMLLLGLALPFLTRPADAVALAYQEWFAQLASTANLRWPGYRDAWSVWELFQSPVDRSAYRVVQLASAAIALAGCWYLRRRAAATLNVLGLGVAWLMLFGPATEFATYVWLAPLVSWAAVEAWRTRKGFALAAAAYALSMVVGCGHFDGWFMPFAPLLLPLGTLLFVAWLMMDECEGAFRPLVWNAKPQASLIKGNLA